VGTPAPEVVVVERGQVVVDERERVHALERGGGREHVLARLRRAADGVVAEEDEQRTQALAGRKRGVAQCVGEAPRLALREPPREIALERPCDPARTVRAAPRA
jgi:hypothetical protein